MFKESSLVCPPASKILLTQTSLRRGFSLSYSGPLTLLLKELRKFASLLLGHQNLPDFLLSAY